jgi:hypothetical protein
MLIMRLSPVSGLYTAKDIDVTTEQLEQWEGGALIQNCMSHLNVDDREFIMTGITPEDWDAEFGGGGDV